MQLPVIILTTALALFFPHHIVFTYSTHWLLWPLLFLLCLNKKAGHRLPISGKKMPIWRWLGIQIFMVLGLWGLLIGIGQTQIYLSSSSQHDNIVNLLSSSHRWGYFQMAFYGLLTTAVAYFCYCQSGSKRIQTTTRRLLNNQPDDALSLTFDFCIRNSVLMNLILSTGIFIVFVAHKISPLPLSPGLTIPVLFSFVLITSVLSDKNHRSSLRALHQQGWHPLFITLAHLCLVASTIVGIHLIVVHFLPHPTTNYLPHLLSHWLHIDHPDLGFDSFCFIWWVLWAPLWAGILLKISGGYSLRSLLLTSALMALFMMLLNQLLPFLLQHTLIISILFSLGVMLILWLMTHPYTVDHLTLGIFPGEPYKSRSIFPFIRYQTEIAPFVGLLTMMLGIGFVGWVFWVIEIAFYYIMIFAILSLTMTWLRGAKI